jgi:hypothetical protein
MFIDDRSVQRALQTAGLYRGEIDGKFGSGSKAAARQWVADRARGYAPSWPDERVRLAAEQAMFLDLGFYSSTIDGIPGPATQVAREKWQDHITFDRESPNPSAGVAKATAWPRQRDCVAFYGQPGHTRNVRLASPYPLFLDWQLSAKVDSFLIHEKCHDSALRAMTAILAHYGPQAIHELGIDQFGGCLNVRKMRNGSAWSMHAFGCAIDFDADRNALRENHRTARFARPEYAPFLDAWEAEGWLSLGRARDMDWMHVQAAQL